MNTPKLEAVGTKTEDTSIAWFLKKNLQSLFFAIAAEYFCRVFQDVALILS